MKTDTVDLAICIGIFLATVLSIVQENIASKRFLQMKSTPEGRLYFSCIESALLPIGLFWFAWTLSSDVHWIVPCLGLGCASVGIYSIYLAVFLYLADVYRQHASSALAAQSLCKGYWHPASDSRPLIVTADMLCRSKYIGWHSAISYEIHVYSPDVYGSL